MNSVVVINIWRFLLLVALQGLLLKQMGVAVGSEYFNVFLFPLFILFLPLQTPASAMVFLGFAIGICVDIFYGVPGVHASAGAFSGFIRNLAVNAFAPKGGFSSKEPVFSPIYVGWPTFMKGAATFFFVHIFWYFSVDAFTLIVFGSILLKTMVSWFITLIFVALFTLLFNPKS